MRVSNSEAGNMCSEVTAHEQIWLQEVKNLQASYKSIVAKYPDASVGEREKWVRSVDTAKAIKPASQEY
jgi:hypothetical protein